MTNDELTKQFEDGIRQLDETEARRFLSARHFGKCLDCGKPIFISEGRRKRCDVCQTKRNHEKMIAFKRKEHKRYYKSTHYQKIVGRSVGR